MNKELLLKHLHKYKNMLAHKTEEIIAEMNGREEAIAYYQSFTAEKIKLMDDDDLYEYLSRLWAMLMWGNKRYYVDKLILDNGLEKIKNELKDLLWGKEEIEKRWDRFKKEIKGMGPAMISEILCKTFPDEYAIWNRRAVIGLKYLGVENLPTQNSQINGKVYKHICEIEKEIAREMERLGIEDHSLLAVDYFIWKELQIEKTELPVRDEEVEFIHDEIKEKIKEIGEWLGFNARTEQKIADGSKVDTIWEATIGNMGRVIYVFEVQTKGNIDSLLMNLLKALNNPAVQGVVAVSDMEQIEKIKKHVQGVPGLKEKLKYWDYRQVIKVHEYLEEVNSIINSLDLVPKGF